MWWHLGFAALLVDATLAMPGTAQAPVPTPAPEEAAPASPSLASVIGEVTATDPAAKQITVRRDAGGTVTVILQDKALYLRVPPGETDLKKSVKIAPSEISTGDRVYARGRFAEDQKSLPALSVIVMTKADLAQKRERERKEWQGALAGTISALSVDSKEITLSVRSAAGTRTLIVEPSEQAVFHRYAPDTVRFVQARPSSFAELTVGDSLRILGKRSADGSRIRAEAIVSGSFRNIVGMINGIDVAAGEMRITDLQSKRPLIVRISADTTVRRMPPPAKPPASTAKPAAPTPAKPDAPSPARPDAPTAKPDASAPTRPDASANRPQGGAGGAAAAGNSTGGPAAAGSPESGGVPRAGASPAATPAGGGPLDVDKMPSVKLAALKRDEMVLVLSTGGVEPSRVTAIVVVAGVEALLGAALTDQTQIGNTWNFFEISLP